MLGDMIDSLTAHAAGYICYELLWAPVLDSQAAAVVTAIRRKPTNPYHLALIWSRSAGQGGLG